MDCEVEQSDDEEMVLSELITELTRLVHLTKGHEATKEIAKKVNAKIKKMKSPNQAISILLTIKNSVNSTVRRGGKIRVQPTSIARRRKGLPRGSKPVPRGRPSAIEVKKRGLKKRPRNLSQAIRDNVASAKSH
jgi:hypothetical protein